MTVSGTLLGPQDAQIFAKILSLVCLSGCFWMSLTFNRLIKADCSPTMGGPHLIRGRAEENKEADPPPSRREFFMSNGL